MASGVRGAKKCVSRKEGFVCKRARHTSNTWKSWNDRFMVLEDQYLCYGKSSEACSKPKECKQIHLKDCVEVKREDPTEGFMHVFSVQTTNYSSHKGRKFIFNAKDDTECEDWIKSIADVLTLKVDKDNEEDNESLRRTKTGISKDSGTGSMDEEEYEGGAQQPTENSEDGNKDYHSSATENGEKSEMDDDDDHDGIDSQQIRPRCNAVNGGFECPNCGVNFIMVEGTKKGKKKAKENDSRSNSKSLASENTDYSTRTKSV